MRRRRRMDSFSYVTYFPAKKNNGIWRETEANNSQSIRGTIPEATSATTIALQCVVRIQWQMDNNHHITISLPNPERRGFKYFDRPPNNPPLRDQFKWEALFTISWQTEKTAVVAGHTARLIWQLVRSILNGRGGKEINSFTCLIAQCTCAKLQVMSIRRMLVDRSQSMDRVLSRRHCCHREMIGLKVHKRT